MSNLNQTPLMLLVRCSGEESAADVFAYMQARYNARLKDANWGPLYKLGGTFQFEDSTFIHLQTFAGSLMMRIIFDARKNKFNRPVIYRFDSGERFRLLTPGGSESEVDETELVPVASKNNGC